MRSVHQGASFESFSGATGDAEPLRNEKLLTSYFADMILVYIGFYM